MTMQERKSIEEQLIKISVRSFLMILGSVIVGVVAAVGMYTNIVNTQERILNEISKTRLDFQYEIKDVRKDIQTIQGQIKGGSQ
jgi:peptidoglycan hydrolase CwlO-like protein